MYVVEQLKLSRTQNIYFSFELTVSLHKKVKLLKIDTNKLTLINHQLVKVAFTKCLNSKYSEALLLLFLQQLSYYRLITNKNIFCN